MRDKYQMQAWKALRLRCRNAAKMIDNDAPRLHPKMPNPTAKARRLDDIMSENQLMLKRISLIWRSPATVDSECPNVLWGTKVLCRVAEMAVIEALNLNMLFFIQTAEPLIPTRKECYKFWMRQLHVIQHKARFPLFFLKSFDEKPLPMTNPPPVEKDAPPRKKVFMEFITSEERSIGRIEIELFHEQAPQTADNFLAYIHGVPDSTKLKGSDSAEGEQQLCYKGSVMHRILPGFYCVGGDLTKFNGIGGASIFEEPLNEKNELEHIEAGLVCTLPAEEGGSDSKFMITFKPLGSLTGKTTVFGRVVNGFGVLQAISSCGAPMSGKPITEVYCCECGEVAKKSNKKRRARFRLETNKSTQSAGGQSE